MNINRVLHFPLTRIAVGIAVCTVALLASNYGLRLLFNSESNLLRVARWLLSTLVLVLAYWFLFRSYERRDISELSRDGMLKECLLGLSAGSCSMGIVIGALVVLGYYQLASPIRPIQLLLPLFLFFALGAFEELIFRGIAYRIAEESLGTHLALLLSALVFGLAHLPNENANIVSVVSAASGGVLAGLLFSMTRRLWLPIFFHTGWNWAQASLGVPVSGMEQIPDLVRGSVTGPALITGGPFGPENSVLTIVLVLALSGVAYYEVWKRGNLVWRARS